LQRLPAESAKEVLEHFEEKCRSMAQRPDEAASRTWGYLVAIVKGEVNDRISAAPATGPPPVDAPLSADEMRELNQMVRAAAAGKGTK
jgi:hypothetical protein